MLNQVYRLVSERHFESFVVSESINSKSIVVRPTYLSICHADQRYYGFERKAEIINKKLPMALIHEGIGEVVFSNDDGYKVGDKVALVPNLPSERNSYIGENYLESSKFRSSSYDGLTQEYIFTDASRVVKIPEGFPSTTAAYIEMMSVSYQALMRLDKKANANRDAIGVWGDGNLGYMVSALLKKKFPNTKLYVFGHHKDKLDYFSFADKTYLTDEIPTDLKINHAIEAAGGLGSENAIDQIIDCICPEGTCVLMGVSENKISFNTRMVLQKGLTFVGSSRSSAEDFQSVVDLLNEDNDLLNQMGILFDATFDIRSTKDLANAFEYDQNHTLGKTILHWEM